LGGFKNVGNPEITNSTGGFSFPVLGLLENAQLRVVTVGKPLVVSPVVTETVAVRVSFHVRRQLQRADPSPLATPEFGVTRLPGWVRRPVDSVPRD
jgi:hypothetical protein